MKNIVYKEIQKFTQIWIWAIIAIVIGIWAWGFIQQLIFGLPWGSKPASNMMLLIFSIIPIAILVLFITMRLETEITNEGIFFQYFPFHMKKRFIDWNDIAKAYVREYKPIREYGGWGLKGGLKSGLAFNVSGKIGLQLELKNGKRILIGTSHPEKLEAFIRDLNSK